MNVRKGKPAEPEMVSEDALEYVQLHDANGKPLDEWMHWDPASGKAVKGAKPGKPKMIPTGSMVQVEDQCHDCGAALVPGHGQPFDFLMCGRMRYEPITRGFVVLAVVEVPFAKNPNITRPVETWQPVNVDGLYAGCVVECERQGVA